MSTTDLGNQAEDHARRVLEDRGYHVHQALQRIRKTWSAEANDVVEQRQEDLWGLFDLAALGPRGLRLVQVTHPSGRHEREEKIREAWDWMRLHSAVVDTTSGGSWLDVEIWVWQGSGFHRYKLRRTGDIASREWSWVKVGAVPVEADS